MTAETVFMYVGSEAPHHLDEAQMESETEPECSIRSLNLRHFVNKDTLVQNCVKTALSFLLLVSGFVATSISLVTLHKKFV